MKVLLFQVDGKFPNLALMRLAAWHRQKGDSVRLTSLLRDVPRQNDDISYASSIFTNSKDRREKFNLLRPSAIVGGDGYYPIWSDLTKIGRNIGSNLREVITDQNPDEVAPDYSDYPNFAPSIGYSQRGCRLDCSFCRMKTREGEVRSVRTLHQLWRGEPYPKHVVLLDNDFFGQQEWKERLDEAIKGKFKICFNQGINIRLINDEQAQVLRTVKFMDDQFKTKRLYTAWDNLGDEKIFKEGIQRIIDAGIKPYCILVYMLIGYRKNETDDERLYRFWEIVKLGCKPYPMNFDRTNRRLNDFQRWAIRRYYTIVPWSEYNPNYANDPYGFDLSV